MPSFNEFDFQTALSPQPGANFAVCDFKKSSDHANSWRFGSFAPAWCKFCRHVGQPILRARPFLGVAFASHRRQLWTNAAFRAIPTRRTTASHTFVLYRLCAITFSWRIFGGNAQYSRKLGSYISCLRVLYDVNLSDVGYVCLWLPPCRVYLPFVSPFLKYHLVISYMMLHGRLVHHHFK